MVEAYELYVGCRNVQVFHMQVEDGQNVQHIVVNFPTGYHHLPEGGGLLDQPNWAMGMFAHFWAGEVAQAARKLSG